MTVTQRAKCVGKTKDVSSLSYTGNQQEQIELLERLCPCCGLDPVMEPHSLCCDIKEFSDYGSGFVIFFSMQKLACFFLLVLGAISLYSLIRNVKANHCIDDSQYSAEIMQYASALGVCTRDWTNFHSIANYLNYKDLKIDVYDKLLMIAFGLFVMLCVSLYSAYMKMLAVEIDMDSDVPEDWTVAVRFILHRLEI